LDEAFDGFSSEVKESCLDVLKDYANDKLVIFNSHSPEFKEHFTSVLVIENDNGVSRVLP
jgi:DNA repair exonuclease SbcCD ATPase subunit